MNIENAVVLVTGANRGIGRAFVEEALQRGARKVYAAMRTPAAWADPRVAVLPLDVTDPAQVAALAEAAPDTTLLVNNAGIARLGGFLADGDERLLAEHLETNLFGILRTTRALAPVLARNGGGAILNVLSVVSWFNGGRLGSYGVSKSAAWGLTNGLREEMRDQKTLVSALHMGFVDTDLTKGFDLPKITPELVVQTALAGVAAGREEIIVDEVTRRVHAGLTAEPPYYLNPNGR